MSNKPRERLNPLDLLIRKYADGGMSQGTTLTIEYISGFELFNTRPYHNYETWSQGYRVTGNGIVVEEEDLDDALNRWVKAKETLPNSDSPKLAGDTDVKP